MALPAAIDPGFGLDSFGSSTFGSLTPATLVCTEALAVAENCIRLKFSSALYYSTILDDGDASNPIYYSVSALPLTTGYDGNPARPVGVATATLSQPGGFLPVGADFGTYVDLTLDRPMTPYPAGYQVTVAGLFSSDSTQALSPATLQLLGVYRQLVAPALDLPHPTRDFANPQNYEATAQLEVPGNIANLGVFPIDSSSDYALDAGFVSYKKRIFRRLMTRPGSFLHLGASYGVGIPQESKKLARATTLQRLAAEAELQIGQEPETERVKVTAAVDPNAPSLVRFVIMVKVRGGQSAKLTTSIPFQV